MSVFSVPRARACRGCSRAATVYTDKYGHLWCVECERWNGVDPTYDGQGTLPGMSRWPGDRWGEILR
jgi:hypothetical protein